MRAAVEITRRAVLDVLGDGTPRLRRDLLDDIEHRTPGMDALAVAGMTVVLSTVRDGLIRDGLLAPQGRGRWIWQIAPQWIGTVRALHAVEVLLADTHLARSDLHDDQRLRELLIELGTTLVIQLPIELTVAVSSRHLTSDAR